MTSTTLFLNTIAFGFSLWLGLYLLSRNFANIALRLTGLGVTAYALAILTNLLDLAANSSTDYYLTAQSFFILLPAIFWVAALNSLLPQRNQIRPFILFVWAMIAVPIYVYLVIAPSAIFSNNPVILLTPILFLPLLLVFIRFVRFSRHTYPNKWKGWLLIATLFFGLSTVLTIMPLGWIPQQWLLPAIGLDLEILAYIIASIDAFEEGENLQRDMLRSLQVVLFVSVLFSGQVALAMHFVTGLTFAMVVLLVGTLSTAITLVTLSAPLSNLFDRLLFNRSSQLRQDRADLRSASQSLSRLDLAIDPQEIDSNDFARYTRRALSNFGDLPRLASNPLTRLPLIESRLNAKQSRPDTLNRAAELKLLLTESVNRLKPPSNSEFGSSDEWRFYNALHFPYVLGLKPYRHKSAYTDLNPTSAQALDWFQVEVPERTLHNWQNAAAKLVAQDLREQSQ